jgi:hypothetical protein
MFHDMFHDMFHEMFHNMFTRMFLIAKRENERLMSYIYKPPDSLPSTKQLRSSDRWPSGLWR